LLYRVDEEEEARHVEEQLRLIADSTVRRDPMQRNATGDIQLAKYENVLPPSDTLPDDIGEWSRYIHFAPSVYEQSEAASKFLYKTDRNNNPQTVETLHNKSKRKVFLDFLKNLSQHEVFKSVTEMVDDDQHPGCQVLRLVKLLRGEVTQVKKDLLNQLVGCWVINLIPKTKSKEHYQPGSVVNYLCKVFKTLWDCCIRIQNQDLKNCKNSYNGYLEKVWAHMNKKDATFGRRPNKATVEHDDQWKIRNAATPPMDPDKNYMDLLSMCMYGVGTDLKCRNGEVSFCFVCLFYFIYLTIFVT
jgi:hypothetical protein